jgi:Mrp family chromosome partitioning ATPase
VALLSDANLLAAMIDIAVIVVSANTTPYPLVRRAVEAIGPAKILGCVLNRTNRPTIALGYRYAYAYRYAPGTEERPKKAWAFPFGGKR